MTTAANPENQPLGMKVGPYVLHQVVQYRPMFTMHLARLEGEEDGQPLRLVKVSRERLESEASDTSSSSYLALEAELLDRVDSQVLRAPVESGSFGSRVLLDFGPLDGVPVADLLRMSRNENARLRSSDAAWITYQVLSMVSQMPTLDRRGESITGLACHGYGDVTMLVTPHGGLTMVGLTDVIVDGARPKAWAWTPLTAPEYCRPGPPIGTGADIYAAGALLFNLLTLRPIISAAELDEFILRRMFRNIHPLPSDVYEDLAVFDPVVDRALKRDPQARHGTAEGFMEELAAVAENLDTSDEAPLAGLYEQVRDAGIGSTASGSTSSEQAALGARTTDILESGWRDATP